MLSLLTTLLTLLTLTTAVPQAPPNTTQPNPITPASAAAPTACIADNFITPWIITNLVIVSPSQPTDSNPAHMSFVFTDLNEALQLTTVCIALVDEGTVQMANGGYVGCEDGTVRFQLRGGELMVSRWFRDPCLGSPPYDSAIAYGQSTAVFETVSSAAGAVSFQQRMEMNVTRMS